MAIINESGELSAMMKKIGEIIKAFNEKGTVFVQNTIFDYSLTIGKIAYIQSGHIHKDGVFYCGEIPVITTNAFFNTGPEWQPTFDVAMIDFSNSKVNFFRIGDGEDRELYIHTESSFFNI